MATPTSTITSLAAAAEAALTTWQNDNSAISQTQGNIQALQTQLAGQETTANTDGAAAYQNLSALDQAIQALLPTLPQPPAPAPASATK